MKVVGNLVLGITSIESVTPSFGDMGNSTEMSVCSDAKLM